MSVRDKLLPMWRISLEIGQSSIRGYSDDKSFKWYVNQSEEGIKVRRRTLKEVVKYIDDQLDPPSVKFILGR